MSSSGSIRDAAPRSMTSGPIRAVATIRNGGRAKPSLGRMAGSPQVRPLIFDAVTVEDVSRPTLNGFNPGQVTDEPFKGSEAMQATDRQGRRKAMGSGVRNASRFRRSKASDASLADHQK